MSKYSRVGIKKKQKHPDEILTGAKFCAFFAVKNCHTIEEL